MQNSYMPERQEARKCSLKLWTNNMSSDDVGTLLTGKLSKNVYDHRHTEKLLPVRQNGCRKGSRGTKDELFIDMMVIKNCKWRHLQ